MKQQDVATIILVIGISAFVSLFVSKAIFVPPKDRQQSIQQVQAITTDFQVQEKDSPYFNSNSLDPTKPITVNRNTGSNPFKGTGSEE